MLSENNMNREQLLSRVEVNPKIMVGKPVIKGTRLPVALILELLAAGQTNKQIIAEYAKIDEQDIAACLYMAAHTIKHIYPSHQKVEFIL